MLFDFSPLGIKSILSNEYLVNLHEDFVYLWLKSLNRYDSFSFIWLHNFSSFRHSFTNLSIWLIRKASTSYTIAIYSCNSTISVRPTLHFLIVAYAPVYLTNIFVSFEQMLAKDELVHKQTMRKSSVGHMVTVELPNIFQTTTQLVIPPVKKLKR